MSFTFVYGNHMDVTKASLALFDAEPGEKTFLINLYINAINTLIAQLPMNLLIYFSEFPHPIENLILLFFNE